MVVFKLSYREELNGPFSKEASDIIVKLLDSEEGNQILENFLKWRVIDLLVPLLSKPFRQERSDLNNRLSGMKPRYRKLGIFNLVQLKFLKSICFVRCKYLLCVYLKHFIQPPVH